MLTDIRINVKETDTKKTFTIRSKNWKLQYIDTFAQKVVLYQKKSWQQFKIEYFTSEKKAEQFLIKKFGLTLKELHQNLESPRYEKKKETEKPISAEIKKALLKVKYLGKKRLAKILTHFPSEQAILKISKKDFNSLDLGRASYSDFKKNISYIRKVQEPKDNLTQDIFISLLYDLLDDLLSSKGMAFEIWLKEMEKDGFRVNIDLMGNNNSEIYSLPFIESYVNQILAEQGFDSIWAVIHPAYLRDADETFIEEYYNDAIYYGIDFEYYSEKKGKRNPHIQKEWKKVIEAWKEAKQNNPDEMKGFNPIVIGEKSVENPKEIKDLLHARFSTESEFLDMIESNLFLLWSSCDIPYEFTDNCKRKDLTLNECIDLFVQKLPHTDKAIYIIKSLTNTIKEETNRMKVRKEKIKHSADFQEFLMKIHKEKEILKFVSIEKDLVISTDDTLIIGDVRKIQEFIQEKGHLKKWKKIEISDTPLFVFQNNSINYGDIFFSLDDKYFPITLTNPFDLADRIFYKRGRQYIQGNLDKDMRVLIVKGKFSPKSKNTFGILFGPCNKEEEVTKAFQITWKEYQNAQKMTIKQITQTTHDPTNYNDRNKAIRNYLYRKAVLDRSNLIDRIYKSIMQKIPESNYMRRKVREFNGIINPFEEGISYQIEIKNSKQNKRIVKDTLRQFIKENPTIRIEKKETETHIFISIPQLKNTASNQSLSTKKDGSQTCECLDWNENKTECYPTILYHATSNIDQVIKEGFKTREQLRQEGKTFVGLGGGTDSLVSFTTDKDLAFIIKRETIRLIQIAKGEYYWKETPDAKDIREILKEDVWIDKEGIERNGVWLWNKLIKDLQEGEEEFYLRPYRLPHGDLWNKYLEGYEMVRGKDWNEYPLSHYKEDAEKDHTQLFREHKELKVIPYENDPLLKYKPTTEEGKYRSVLVYDPDLIQFELFEMFRNHYLAKRQLLGGEDNPLFWGSNFVGFQKMDCSQVSVIEAQVQLPIDLDKILQMKPYAHAFAKRNDYHRYDLYNSEYWYYFDTLEKYGHTGEKIGFEMCEALGEIRLHPKYVGEIREITKQNKDPSLIDY